MLDVVYGVILVNPHFSNFVIVIPQHLFREFKQLKFLTQEIRGLQDVLEDGELLLVG